MSMTINGGKGEKLFWNWSEDNGPRKENRWFEIEVIDGELEVWA